mmetsp:Transcript_55862/g.155754  ORF Transcript_55862/g.155754 Transcript_55862/m.155754 type:complete len:373 (+) Transcript_55862:98-1216(+)
MSVPSEPLSRAGKAKTGLMQWFGGLLVHIAFCLLWTIGGVCVAGTCAMLAGYTYGLSFAIFGSVTMKHRRSRQAWALACLTLFALSGPRHVVDSGFTRYWVSWVWLSFSAWIAWFWDFKPRPWFRNCIANVAKAYYSSCELRGALSDVEKGGSLFGFHPHGILAVGFSMQGVWCKDFHEHAGFDTMHLVDKVLRDDNPYFKVLCDVHGNIETLTKESLQACMRERRNISFIPGGFEDATAMAFGKDRTVMRRRTGFIKYALQHGYRVHPVYTFGESSTYRTFTGFVRFRLWLNKFGVPAVIFFGFPWLPLLPRPQAELTTCVGKAIQMPRIAEPSKEDVEKWHRAYCDALEAVFHENKEAAGLPKSATLDVW